MSNISSPKSVSVDDLQNASLVSGYSSEEYSNEFLPEHDHEEASFYESSPLNQFAFPTHLPISPVIYRQQTSTPLIADQSLLHSQTVPMMQPNCQLDFRQYVQFSDSIPAYIRQDQHLSNTWIQFFNHFLGQLS